MLNPLTLTIFLQAFPFGVWSKRRQTKTATRTRRIYRKW